MKTKVKIFLYILGTILILGDIKYFTYPKKDSYFSDPFRYKQGSRCGIVVDNFTELRNIKRGTITDYYLKVKYNNETKIENVSAETFYDNYKIDSNICFINYKIVDFFSFSCILLTFLIIVFGSFILLIVYLLD